MTSPNPKCNCHRKRKNIADMARHLRKKGWRAMARDFVYTVDRDKRRHILTVMDIFRVFT